MFELLMMQPQGRSVGLAYASEAGGQGGNGPPTF